jgi:hypothetical protein
VSRTVRESISLEPFTIYAAFNYAECALWWVIGVFVCVRARRKIGRQKFSLFAAGAVLVVFGLSDWFEASREGAIPAWLWAMKIVCGAGLLACRFSYLGWHQFHWRRGELWFAVFCLVAVIAVIWLQHRWVAE